MGVDSGLPDFRGTEGFWNAYPPYRSLGLSFSELANPRWFSKDPAFAWGFYGHRLELYRKTRPHSGFSVLRRLTERLPHGAFVFTSNVDGQFQRAGFDPETIVECHGAIDWMQCLKGCGVGLFSADPYHLQIDPTTFRAAEPLPKCPQCGALARPNILMFGDWGWESTRTDAQEYRFALWLQSLPKKEHSKIVVIECGAGTGIPTVRMTSERVARNLGGTLVRINVREPEVPEGQVGLALGAAEALEKIEAAMREG